MRIHYIQCILYIGTGAYIIYCSKGTASKRLGIMCDASPFRPSWVYATYYNISGRYNSRGSVEF